jgi:hypothetical protein
VEALIENERASVTKAADVRDIPSLLRLVPGKELLNFLCTKIGHKSARTVLVHARKDGKVENYASLAELREKLRLGLALTGPTATGAPHPRPVG